MVDGRMLNIDWHQKRYLLSYLSMYNKSPLTNLVTNVNIPLEFNSGVYKLRISYNDRYKKIEFIPYAISKIETIKVVVDNEIKYDLKYSDRDKLLAAYKQKNSCDDVLIIKNGMVTDSSYSNIVFFDGKKWVTPSNPLLNGTARARLLSEKLIEEQHIKLEDLPTFESFKLINALRDFEKVDQSDISNIEL